MLPSCYIILQLNGQTQTYITFKVEKLFIQKLFDCKAMEHVYS